MKTDNLCKKHQLALIIPGHNEELVIEKTIRSAMSAGLSATHIYVVSDNSTDKTEDIAIDILGKTHVIAVTRSGKALAVKKAIRAFDIEARYDWLHIADADSVFEDRYFSILKKELNTEKYIAITGYVGSMHGGWISKYRAYEYSFGQEIMRRIQHMLGVIPVIPGPTSCFQTNILKELDFETQNFTEDFDITIQIHRKKLGRIGFVAQARTLTQDPKDFQDYVKQITRWYRGFWQGVLTYKIGRGWQKIDAYLGYQILEMFAYYFNLLVLLPFLLLKGQGAHVIALTFLLDVSVFFIMTIMACVSHRRLDIISAFPLFYLLRITNMAVYVKAFFEVVIFRKFRGPQIGWSTGNRRYKVAES